MASHFRNNLLVIMGPTAAGKSALALELAKAHQGEIINADSRQVYVGMDVGTDKITSRVLERGDSRDEPVLVEEIPHYLIDILTPDQQYSAAEFRDDARRIISGIRKRDRLPIIAGGTGFYIRVLTGDRTLEDAPPDPAFRKWAETKPMNALARELRTLAPDLSEHLDNLQNRRRVTRYLEIARVRRNKQRLSASLPPPDWHTLKLALVPPSAVLRSHIEARVDRMLQQGLLDEVRDLVERYGASAPGLQTPGYRQVLPFVAGQASLEKTRVAIVRAHRETARRQLTWLNKEPGIVRVTDVTAAERLVKTFLS